jgi:coproporphyrinogen III oxidase
MKPANIDALKSAFADLQTHIVECLEGLDGASFGRDAWQRPDGGGGLTRVLAEGNVFEKAGVGFSHVYGDRLPPAATRKRPELADKPFHAVGVSLVIHPRNPYVPTSHANVRYFLADDGNSDPVWWFGGGFDLTPYYPFDEDVLHWHQTAKRVCDTHHADWYGRFKPWCDEYFYLPHRQEARGVGGLFFDDLNEPNFERCRDFTFDVGRAFCDAYAPIVKRRFEQPYGEHQRDFQQLRRGRYVEFNLVHDRGTLFGLQSGGRTESILMSLPPTVQWQYGFTPAAGSDEARLLDYLKPRDWLTELA